MIQWATNQHPGVLHALEYAFSHMVCKMLALLHHLYACFWLRRTPVDALMELPDGERRTSYELDEVRRLAAAEATERETVSLASEQTGELATTCTESPGSRVHVLPSVKSHT